MGPCAGVDYYLTVCPVQRQLKHIYHGQPYDRVDFIPQSVTLDFVSDYSCKVPFFEYPLFAAGRGATMLKVSVAC